MKVLLFEVNEITWRFLDPLIAQGALPAFSFLKQQGAYGSTTSVDLGDNLDPWITWTTVYTGKPQEEHGVLFLEQPAETIRAKRIWELAAEAGVSVGIYGSVNSWPPHPVKGFWVPGTFAQDPSTYPESLRPIQELNLWYTRKYNYGKFRGNDGLLWKAYMGMRLAILGLRPRTAFETLAHLAQERRDPQIAWKRVSLQPLINFDVFARLFRAYQPALATFHTNHVAHYQHLYWRVAQPELFPDAPSTQERETYRGAIEHGYKIADRVLAQMLDLIDSDTILFVASSMGQQPYKNPTLVKGKRLLRIRSFNVIIDLLELEGQIRVVPTMADQFNVYAVSQEVLDRVAKIFIGAYIDRPEQPMFGMQRTGNALTVCVAQFNDLSDESICHLPVNGQWKKARYGELVEMSDHSKSGCHHPAGVLMVYGPGVRPGPLSHEVSTLDLAPTILQVLGVPKDNDMKGTSISEVVGSSNRPRTSAAHAS
jgi:hypothetical protein